MPLYECTVCHSIDNTALTNFWDARLHDQPLLCSACDPEIGQWHGKFPRETADEHLAKHPGSRIQYQSADSITGDGSPAAGKAAGKGFDDVRV